MANRHDVEEEKKPEKLVTEGVPYGDALPGDLLALDAATKTGLEKFCHKAIESWISSAGSHHANLRRWNDLLEGVMEETNFPWDGCSQLHVPVVAIHVVTLHSVIARSMLTVDPLWHVRTLDNGIRSQAADIEEAISYKAKSELNLIEAFRDVMYTTCRDGLGWLQMIWAHETEKVETVLRVSSVDEFIKEVPEPEAAGMTPEQYEEMKVRIQMSASVEAPYEVRVHIDRVDYSGPKAYVVDEADMVRAPMTAPTLKDCRVYGKKYSERIEVVKKGVSEGKYWKDAVSSWAIRNKTKSDDSWKKAREAIEGIASDNTDFADDRELFNLVVRYEMKGYGECKLLVTYSHDQKKVLGAVKYPYTRDCYIPFRIIRRPGRMIGVSVPERLEELNTEIDASVNYEINSNAIELAPLFKGKKAKKKDLDLELEENWIAPGKTIWLDDPTDFEQFKILANSKDASKSLRQELMRYGEMEIGPTQLLSGKESMVDPDAPGNKTIALIQQSNMRIEDYINEFRLGFDEAGDMVVALYYQFGGGILSYQTKEGEVQEIQRDILRGRPKMSAHGVTANMSPEVEFNKAMQWFQVLMPIPDIGGNPIRRRELISRLMVSGRIPNREALLPSNMEAEEAFIKDIEKQAQDKLMADLIKKGILPPPPVPSPVGLPGPLAGLPPPLAPAPAPAVNLNGNAA